MSAAHNRVRLDLNSAEFQDVLFQLEPTELKEVGSWLPVFGVRQLAAAFSQASLLAGARSCTDID